jgi:hypothetical protein
VGGGKMIIIFFFFIKQPSWFIAHI